MIPVDSFYEKMLENLEAESYVDSLTEKLESLGFETTWMIPNLGSVIFIFVNYFILLGVLLVMKALTYCFPDKIRGRAHSLSKFLLWRWPIRFLKDSWAVVAICCLVNVAYSSWSTIESRLNSAFAVIMLAFMMLYPALMQLYLYFKRHLLRDREFKDRFHAAYGGLIIVKNKFVVYPLFFYYRRTLCLMCIIFFPSIFIL